MFFDSTSHIVSTIPAPTLSINRYRQTSDMLMSESQTIIRNANTKLLPSEFRFAFEFKHHVNTDWYSDSFSIELKKVITAYYTFHRYEVKWNKNILIVSWAPSHQSIKSEDCNSDYDDYSSDFKLQSSDCECNHNNIK
jgi:hypothetical protein